MEALPDTLDDAPADVAAPAAAPLELVTAAPTTRQERLRELAQELRFPTLVYGSALALLYATALINIPIRGWTLRSELGNWDGVWYRGLALRGYLTHPALGQTRNGFFPLYPALMRVISDTFGVPVFVAGVVISGVAGLIATLLIYRLAEGWWGRDSARRAIALFCFFPGAVVFAMVYTEGLLLALAAGCILALQRRRWLIAGLLAGAATAVEPDAIAIVPVCAVAAALELRRLGWRDPEARRSLLAPLLAPTGVVAFAGYMWVRTGSPWATYLAQRNGWQEKTDLLAIVHLVTRLAAQISFTHFNEPTVNANYPVGIIGTGILIGAFILLWKERRTMSLPAWVWTLGISFFAMTSENVPPNPRMLITAFPVVLIFARRLHGKAYKWVLGVSVVLFVFMSACTYVGVTLRP